MFYQTRDLIARRPMLYDGQDLQVGDRFTPMSKVDAEYLIARQRAVEAQDEVLFVPPVVAAPAAPPPVEVVVEVPTEPLPVEMEPVIVEAIEPAAEPVADESAEQTAPRRRGRPSSRQAAEPDPTL